VSVQFSSVQLRRSVRALRLFHMQFWSRSTGSRRGNML